MLARGEDIVPLIGARRRDRLDEALGALDVTLDDATSPASRTRSRPAWPQGDRYAAAQMAMLDTER